MYLDIDVYYDWYLMRFKSFFFLQILTEGVRDMPTEP